MVDIAMGMHYLSEKGFVHRVSWSNRLRILYIHFYTLAYHYYLHERQKLSTVSFLCTKDLAARNIFMDENELCKVGDFGLLRETSKREGDGENLYILQVSTLGGIQKCMILYLLIIACLFII